MRNNDSPGKESSGTGSVEGAYKCTDCEWYTTSRALAKRHDRRTGHLTLGMYVLESETHTSEDH